MSFEEAMTDAGVDYTATLHRFGGKKEMFVRFVRNFPQDKTFSALGEAVAANDYDSIAMQAHTLKGTCANLGFDCLSAKCSDLVSDLRAKITSTVEDRFDAIAAEYERIVTAIRSLE